MASVNGGKNDASEIADADEDSMSMLDVLAEEKQLEDDADAVLGDSDDKNCTYQMGYVTRQALYACMTCTPESTRPAGICLACSFECHEGHDLCELYTKRHFRCDCGNSTFPEINCKLNPIKQANNVDNKYNQNFRGLYCACSRPYPDPEDDVEDEMIQCIICEDWHHSRHLGIDGPVSSDFSEMICSGCTDKLSFLRYYHVKSKEIALTKEETEATVDVESCPAVAAKRSAAGDVKTSTASLSPSQGTASTSKNTTESHKKAVDGKSQDNGNSSQDAKDKKVERPKNEGIKSNGNGHCSSSSQEPASCLLKELEKRQIQQQTGAATFWPDRWRDKLCRCVECMDLYTEKEVDFLTEESDTVKAYEERGKAKRGTGSQYEQGMQVLSDMDRVQQVEVLHEYNDLKSELKEYLKKFAENGKIVREEDIREFFTQMQGRKKQRVSSQLVYNCR